MSLTSILKLDKQKLMVNLAQDWTALYENRPYWWLDQVDHWLNQLRNIKIFARLRGLGEWNNRNSIEFPRWVIYFFCFIPLSLVAMLEL